MRAVVVIPHDDQIRRWARECMDHCERHGYELAAIVEDHDGNGVRDAAAMVAAGEADIIVAARLGHLTRHDRLPRIEIAEPGGGISPHQRRPHAAGGGDPALS